MLKFVKEPAIGFIESALKAQPWTIPGLIVTVILSGIWFVFRKSTSSRPTYQLLCEALLIGWVGCFIAVTMTPSEFAESGYPEGEFTSWTFSIESCGREWAAPVTSLTNLGERSLNVLITIPAGLFAVISKRWRPAWIIAALTAPIIAEGAQLQVAELMRVCQFRDLQDNYQGVLIGVVLGAALLIFWLLLGKLVHKSDSGQTS